MSTFIGAILVLAFVIFIVASTFVTYQFIADMREKKKKPLA